MGPIDYIGAFPQQDFLRDIQGGLQIGQAFKQRNLQEEQRLAAQQQEAAYQADVSSAMSNPNPQAFAALALKYPKQREAFKQGWDQLSAGERKSQGEAALQAGFALESGNPDAAKKVLQTRITALDNSGGDSSHEKLILDSIDKNPNAVRGQLLQWAAFVQDPEKFAENFGKLGGEQRSAELQPTAVRRAKAEAGTAESEEKTKAITAKYADQAALLDLSKKGWDIKSIESDIGYKKEQNRIAALNAALNREGNNLKREELQLKIDDAKTARDDKVREKTAKAESAAGTMDNMLNTVERVLKNPSLNDVVGSIEGRLPAVLSDEAADAVALIDTLGSQAFLSQVPTVQGLGSLSNAEGEKLQSALQNLSRTQSEKQFRTNMAEVKRLVGKARDNVSNRYGVPLGSPDTPAAPRQGGSVVEVDF